MADHALAGEYFFLTASVADGGTQYVLWLQNVDTGEGTDPLLPGKTSVRVDFFTNDDADIIAGMVAASIAGLPEFTNVSVVGTTITFDNVSAGTFTPASDFNTGFTFTAPTLIANLKTTNFNVIGETRV